MKNPLLNVIGLLCFVVLLFLKTSSCFASSSQDNDYEAVPGLIDLRSTFSDGTHSIEDLARMAHSRGFKVIFINDHDRIALS
ncbi:PHP domain-containing protein [Thermodesulfobacteriota bacterium]